MRFDYTVNLSCFKKLQSISKMSIAKTWVKIILRFPSLWPPVRCSWYPMLSVIAAFVNNHQIHRMVRVKVWDESNHWSRTSWYLWMHMTGWRRNLELKNFLNVSRLRRGMCSLAGHMIDLFCVFCKLLMFCDSSLWWKWIMNCDILVVVLCYMMIWVFRMLSQNSKPGTFFCFAWSTS